MLKPKILIADSGLIQPYMAPLWQAHFEIEPFDLAQNQSLDCAVLVDDRYGDHDLYLQIKARGHRIIKTHLMDSFVTSQCENLGQEFVLRARDWVWIQESNMWNHRGYNQPRPPQTPDKFFLLLMNLTRQHRDHLLSAMTTYLDCSLHSYVSQGRLLPDDVFVPIQGRPGTANDRHYVPRWYGETCFSLVCETMVNYPSKPITGQLFISEKTFKPLAHAHAFVTHGTQGTLSYLHSLGFETMSHVIDESYDQCVWAEQRLQKISDVVQELYGEFKSSGQVFQDARTQQILAHNQARFFDQALVADMFAQQIAEPIREYVES